MNDFCDNPHCENPSFKEVPVSVSEPGDQVRALCTICEEAYTWGVQHGGMAAKLSDLDGFMLEGGFVILAKNRQDPSQGTPFEAWAYKGPLDFRSATSVTFDLGADGSDALRALDQRLAGALATQATALTAEQMCLLVDERELATILAALRFHQAENLQGTTKIADEAIKMIATDAGVLQPLDSDEVEALCERINVNARPTAVHPAIQRIHDLLYLDMKDGQEFYDPDKNWDADVMAAIAEVVAEYIPRPQ